MSLDVNEGVSRVWVLQLKTRAPMVLRRGVGMVRRPAEGVGGRVVGCVGGS